MDIHEALRLVDGTGSARNGYDRELKRYDDGRIEFFWWTVEPGTMNVHKVEACAESFEAALILIAECVLEYSFGAIKE